MGADFEMRVRRARMDAAEDARMIRLHAAPVLCQREIKPEPVFCLADWCLVGLMALVCIVCLVIAAGHHWPAVEKFLLHLIGA